MAGLFGLMALLRGDHWLIEDDAATICIGEPVEDWLKHQPRTRLEQIERAAAPVSIGIGITALMLPIIKREIELANERKHEQANRRNSQPIRGQTEGADAAPGRSNGSLRFPVVAGAWDAAESFPAGPAGGGNPGADGQGG